MNKYIKNFYDLHSLDKVTSYKAILEKKDWLFQKLYIPYTFDKKEENGKELYEELYALMDQAVLFKKLELDDEIFEEHLDKKDKILENFNKDFSLLYLYSHLTNKVKKGTFFVEYDFTKMSDKMYKELVANFFPCISSLKDLDLFYDENNIIDLLKFAMYGEEGKWVLIISKNALLNDRYYIKKKKKIYFNSSLITKDQEEGLKEISQRCSIPIGEYYGD